VAFGSAGSFVVVAPDGSVRANTAFDPWAISSLAAEPEPLSTDRSTIVWPPMATLGGVSVPPDPIFSLTRKCGVESGGCVWVWLCRRLVEAPDARAVEDAELDVDVDVDVATADELADDAVAPAVAVAPVVAAGSADVDVLELELELELVELEWLLDPHAATSSAVISAAPMRLTIDPA
jgi:hypothetical protein